MKTIRHILLSLAACSVLFVSCVKETQINGGEGVNVSILIATGGNSETRSETRPGSEEDRKIEHFRVLIFRSEGGTLAHKDAFTPPANPQKIEMKTGVYDFVLIANDNVDDDMKDLLDALEEDKSRISALNKLSFASSVFNNVTRIPMVLVVRGVKVYPEGRIELPGRSDQDEGAFSEVDKTWNVSLKRLAVRVDLKIKLSAGQTVDASKKLLIDKVPTCVYLLPDENNEGYEEEPRKYDVPSAVGGELIWERIILPESMFDNASNADNGVTISLTVNDVECTTVIGLDTKNAVEASRNYTLPRNTYLDIEATANPQQQALDCSATVVPWNEDPKQNIIADGPYWLKVDKDELIIPALGGSENFIAETNYENISPSQGCEEGIVYWTEDDWITLTPGGTKTNRTISVSAGTNTVGDRTAEIKVQAGSMIKVIHVKQSTI